MFVCVLCVYLLQREKKEKRAGYKQKEEEERSTSRRLASICTVVYELQIWLFRELKKKKMYLNPKLLVQKS